MCIVEKVKNAARKISGKALFIIERRRFLYKNYLSDSPYKNKRNLKKVEKVIKCESRRFEMGTMEKIANDLGDAVTISSI